MEISEVRIKLMDGVQDRLLGFCSITLDRSFVIRDLKIIRGTRGAFVAMPSRKLTDRCRNCSNKNPLLSAYCSQCGFQLPENRSLKMQDGKAKLYADIAHPINSDCRELIQQHVLSAYDEELVLAQGVGYVCRYDDFDEFERESEESTFWEADFARREHSHSQRRWEVSHEEPARGPHQRESERVTNSFSGHDDGFGDGLF